MCFFLPPFISMFLNSSGLFPLLANAAMSVKPTLLSLYEIYYLPLGKTLKPGLQGLLTGILPGLEEGSEYYERWNGATVVATKWSKAWICHQVSLDR